jgi:hypothetical protein
MAETYETNRAGGISTGITDAGAVAGDGVGAPRLDVNTAVVTPTDRIRWGPVLAGLFVALSTLAVLSVLGIAVAGTAYDPGDRARNFGIGAGIWGGISMLIAFCIGGWIAARSAAVRGGGNALLNGMMVWAVAIPLLLYMVAGTAMRTAATAAQVGAQAAMNQNSNQANSAGEAVTASARVSPQDSVSQSTPSARDASDRVAAAATPERQEQAARTTARTAWGTLVSLLLALAASAAGGYLGARRTFDRTERVRPAVA